MVNGDEMKLTIDTQQDSYEDIAKVLHILTGILERKGSSGMSNGRSNGFSNSANTTPADTSSMMSMFGNDDAVPVSSSVSAPSRQDMGGTAPDFSSFLNLTKQQVPEKKDLPKIEIY